MKITWEDAAFKTLCTYINTHVGQKIVAEIMRDWAEDHGLESPIDKRSWGPVIKRLESKGIIKKVGYAPAVSSHGGPKVLWELMGETSAMPLFS